MYLVRFLKLLSRLPLWALYAFTSLVYVLVYHLLRFRREVVWKNLRDSFPELDHRELARLCRKSYKHLGQVLAEAIKGLTMSEQDLRQRVRFVNPDILDEFIERGQSIILLAAHQCNWEWLLLAACVELALPVDAVYKPLHNRPIDELMLGARSRFGASPIPVQQFLIEIMRRGRGPRAFALVADQTPLRREEKYWTRFLNQETAFYVGPQKIAQITNSPVVFLRMTRTRRGYYEAHLKILAQPPYPTDGYEILEAYAREAERQILEHPADWLWLYRKWKYKKPLYHS
jgi:Kdo2-lipid IVA lauroyltransferase/acyltransferase